MKIAKKILAVMLCVFFVLSVMPIAFAATVDEATIHTERDCSLDIYKYDFTNAEKDGVWQEDSFVSTGRKESYVEDALGKGAVSDLGNGNHSNGYAIQGVQFTYLKVANIVTYTEAVDGVNTTMVLYGFDKSGSEALFNALGLSAANAYAPAATSHLDNSNLYFTADTLNDQLAAALKTNSTAVKDALEAFVAKGTKMELTDANGHTHAADLNIGLYLIVETMVPEMVTNTTDPFFISLPMTTVDGDENSANGAEGGLEWNYNVTIYPKNRTGIPTLEKTVREANISTGKNDNTSAIDDGYAHTATASTGDILEYQIISTLPTITSKATSLSVYKFCDEIAAGLSYRSSVKDVKIEFFTDEKCATKPVATWTQTDAQPKFTVEYAPSETAPDYESMTITVNEAGLAEINGRTGNTNGNIYASYSNYTARVTYTVSVDADNSTIFGVGTDGKGNTNKVTLTWQRSSKDYYDTLVDDCHVYVFGIDLTKQFSTKDSALSDSLFAKVKFKLYNSTDGYYVQARLDDAEKVYYVTGFTKNEDEATAFTPVTVGGEHGRIIVKGLEDDTYTLTEITTANGFSLLKDNVTIVISAMKSGTECDVYSSDVLGVKQNDERYSPDAVKNGTHLALTNIPQTGLHHELLTATATVDGNAVDMVDGTALAKLTIVNRPGFSIPFTGASGICAFGFISAAMAAGAVLIVVTLLLKKKEKDTTTEQS